jgi:hypothetical protein
LSSVERNPQVDREKERKTKHSPHNVFELILTFRVSF